MSPKLILPFISSLLLQAMAFAGSMWISPYNNVKNTTYGVYCFEKRIDIKEKSENVILKISADNRFKFYVNNSLVSIGPSVGDLQHWHYNEVNVAPFLKKGKNLIKVIVWNDGELKPIYQFSNQTALYIESIDLKDSLFNTNETWLCTKLAQYIPLKENLQGYYVVGPGEFIDTRVKSVNLVSTSVPNDNVWKLTPNTLPAVRIHTQRFVSVRRVLGCKVSKDFPTKSSRIIVPPHSDVMLLLDQGELTNAFVHLQLRKGENAVVRLCYDEALYDGNFLKGNRNDIVGKKLLGRIDSLVLNGQDYHFTGLNWRTFRYVQLDVKTLDEPLIIEDIYSESIAYPFDLKSGFQSSMPLLDTILNVGWRTAKLCAVETYMDCPFYEQLQYIGDTRIQALVSYYNANDDRLARKAISFLGYSQQSDGVLCSRYPSNARQIIPTFSFMWVGMLYDYFWYRPDTAFVKSQLPIMRKVLNYFEAYQNAEGLLVGVPNWKFTDWVTDGNVEWKRGVAPLSKQGLSAAIDLQHLMALQYATRLEGALGSDSLSELFQRKANDLSLMILKKYYSEKLNMFADNDDLDTFSEQVNVLAILTDVVQKSNSKELFQRVLHNNSIAHSSIYFNYYTHLAMRKVGLGDSYLQNLDVWKKNLRLGLTTWAEDSDVESARSDCHAWGASPNIELYRILAGIDSDAPSFSKLRVQPNPGVLTSISGVFSHPKGYVRFDYLKNENNEWSFQIQMPENLTGVFVWDNKEFSLVPGLNIWKFK